MSAYSCARINAMTIGEFVDAFADIAERSAWVALRAAVCGPFADRQTLIDAFVGTVKRASADEQRALLCAHPDLAGRAAMAEASVAEQRGAGLDRLTAAEFQRFQALNASYRDRFGFPFIFAVKGADKTAILAAFEDRIHNDPDTERATALDQVCRIIRFRLEECVRP